MENTNLTFEDFNSVQSPAALHRLYEQHGFNLNDPEQFLKQVKQDWSNVLKETRLDYLSKPIPERLPSIDVKVDDRNYHIHGIIHSFLGKSYSQLVSETVKPNQTWLLEEGLGLFFHPEVPFVGLADSSANNTKDKLQESSLDGLILPILGLQIASKLIKRKQSTTHALKYLNIPAEAKGTFPAYVEIAIREQQHLPYTTIQKRSAYQSVFMKIYKPDLDKHLLVGINHAPENKYFLLQRVKDNQIIDLASQHAEICSNDPNEYQHLLKKLENRNSLILSLGVGLGSSPYWLGYIALMTQYFR